MNDEKDCPGRFKCHGPVSFCEQCGDVDLICDDPKCDQHLRWNEKRAAMLSAKAAYEASAYETERLRRKMEEAERTFHQHDKRPAVMVAR